jgi:hypothetical protein
MACSDPIYSHCVELMYNEKIEKFVQFSEEKSIDYSVYDSYLFRCACIMNKINYAKYMYKKCPNIEIHAYGYEAFKYACGHGSY